MCPWVPAAFFEDILRAWSRELSEECNLLCDVTASGPSREQFQQGSDPLSSGRAEAGVICAPTLIWASQNQPPRLTLAGWTPVFEEVHRPIYHSLVIVRKDFPAESLEDLRRARWCFNDPCSLSGYFSILTSMDKDDAASLVKRARFSGGHMESLALVARGEADACAVDSNGWLIHGRDSNEAWSGLRAIVKLGPFPTQPFVLSAAITPQRQRLLRQSLQRVAHDPTLLEHLRQRYSLVRFVPTRMEDFESLQRRLT